VLETGLNIAIMLGIALTLLKGADLLLRPHQRRAIQIFLEDVTLRLDQIDFKEIAHRMTTPEAQFCFIMLAYFEFAFMSLFVIVFQTPLWEPGGSLHEAFGKEGRYFQLGMTVLGFVTILVCSKWPIPIVMRCVIGTAKSRFVVIIRFLGFSAVFFVVLGVYQFIILDRIDAKLGHNPFGPPSIVRMVGLAIVLPPWMIFFVVFQAIGAMLQARMFYVRWTFVLIRGIMWRIVEYDKGATAAILLIVTILLTLTKELLM
jgi:hypothetical protein